MTAKDVDALLARLGADVCVAFVGTGRSDFANQVNNSLGSPGIFRGVLDARARTFSDDMAIAAASELARYVEQRGLDPQNILPRMDEWDVYPRVAVATARAAQNEGLALSSASETELHEQATRAIRNARESTAALMKEGLIAPPPPPSPGS